jgi:hypothetical protein
MIFGTKVRGASKAYLLTSYDKPVIVKMQFVAACTFNQVREDG